MVRPLRLLAVLAMGVALATATGAAAIAIPPPPTTIEDQDDRRPLSHTAPARDGGSRAVRLPGSFEHFYLQEYPRVDAATGKLLDRYPLDEPTALAVDGQTLWVATGDGRLHRIDIATGAVTARPTELVARIRVGQGGLWLMSFDGKVLRADRRTGRIVAQVPGALRAADLAVGAEGVWVYDQHQGAVLRIDPATNRVARTIPVISQPLVEVYSRVLALGDGAVWVVDKAGEALVRVDPNR